MESYNIDYDNDQILNEMLKLLGVTQNWCQETYMIPFNVITNK